MRTWFTAAGVLLAITGAVLVAAAARALALHRRALTWPAVPGEVVRSALRATTDGDGTSWRAELACAYTAGGHRRTTRRHTHGSGAWRFDQAEQAARALVQDFPVGKAVQIHVDPADPAGGVLVTGKPGHMLVLRRVGLAAVVAGLVLVSAA